VRCRSYRQGRILLALVEDDDPDDACAGSLTIC
jgi:hypothetical protein